VFYSLKIASSGAPISLKAPQEKGFQEKYGIADLVTTHKTRNSQGGAVDE